MERREEERREISNWSKEEKWWPLIFWPYIHVSEKNTEEMVNKRCKLVSNNGNGAWQTVEIGILKHHSSIRPSAKIGQKNY